MLDGSGSSDARESKEEGGNVGDEVGEGSRSVGATDECREPDARGSSSKVVAADGLSMAGSSFQGFRRSFTVCTFLSRHHPSFWNQRVYKR